MMSLGNRQMPTASEMYPTQSPEALRSFAQAQQSLNRYWGTQADADLEAAARQFEQAEKFDPDFGLASLYLAVTDNEARRHAAAIQRLTVLIQRHVDLQPQAYLQLAYAHAKQYTDEDYREAESALDRAERLAESSGGATLLPSIRAYRVFLFAVIGGRSRRKDRADYLNRAIDLGIRLLRRRKLWPLKAWRKTTDAVEMETRNGLGIAYMWQGQQASQDQRRRKDLWDKAERQFDAVLKANPRVVRVVQNLATLRLMQGDAVARIDSETGKERYREALDLYAQTIQSRPHDEFPHYRSALLFAKLGEWTKAKAAFDAGREQPGSVKDNEWDELARAIDARDPSQLRVLA